MAARARRAPRAASGVDARRTAEDGALGEFKKALASAAAEASERNAAALAARDGARRRRRLRHTQALAPGTARA